MEIEISEFILAVENQTILKLNGADEAERKEQIRCRYLEVEGILQLAKRLDLDERIIKAVTEHRDWLKRTMDRAQ